MTDTDPHGDYARAALTRELVDARRIARLAGRILARILTTGDAAVYTAADGSRFLGLDYSTVDLTDAEAAYLEALDR